MTTQITKKTRYVFSYFAIFHVFCTLLLLYGRIAVLIKRLSKSILHHLLLSCSMNRCMSEMFEEYENVLSNLTD